MLELFLNWLPMIAVLVGLFLYARYGGRKYNRIAEMQRRGIDAFERNTEALKANTEAIDRLSKLSQRDHP